MRVDLFEVDFAVRRTLPREMRHVVKKNDVRKNIRYHEESLPYHIYQQSVWHITVHKKPFCSGPHLLCAVIYIRNSRDVSGFLRLFLILTKMKFYGKLMIIVENHDING